MGGSVINLVSCILLEHLFVFLISFILFGDRISFVNSHPFRRDPIEMLAGFSLETFVFGKKRVEFG